MARMVILYASVMAAAAFALQWLEYRYLARAFSTEIYIAMIAVAFVALGVWAGRKLTPQPVSGPFVRNDAAVASLGLTPRECEILALLASGQSNKALARTLGISPNTVKTHLARLFEKLEVSGRIQAIETARELGVIA